MTNEITEIIKASLVDFLKEADPRENLTEDDLRCNLFSKLKHDLRNHERASVHAEVRWYGDERETGAKKLLYRSDIVIIDNKTLDNPETEQFNIGSKGYGFHDYYAAIELKLRRPNNRDRDAIYYGKIESDIKKLKQIGYKTSRENHPLFWVMLMDKRRGTKRAWIVSSDSNSVTEI
jgi:hypothetical protein